MECRAIDREIVGKNALVRERDVRSDRDRDWDLGLDSDWICRLGAARAAAELAEGDVAGVDIFQQLPADLENGVAEP